MSAPTLRDYQNETLDANAEGFFDLKLQQQMTVLPTGTGKTVVFAQLLQHPRIANWLATFPERHRCMLVLAHRKELLTQAASKIRSANPSLFVEIEQAEKRASMFADVVVGSVASMINRLDQFDPARFRIIVVDEAHHAAASSYQKIFEHFGVMPRSSLTLQPGSEALDPNALVYCERTPAGDVMLDTDPTKMLLGFTATTKRGDDVGLSHIFKRIAYSRPLRWFVDRGYLSRLRGMHVDTTIDLDAVHSRDGDFIASELAAAVNTPQRNDMIVKAWLDAARDRKTIGFTCDIAHAHDLAETYRAAGIRAMPISGKTPDVEREQLLRAFAAGDVQVLTNCNVLTEGFDEPSVSCIVHARPTKSSLLYIQMTGRGTRLSPGKSDLLILDCCDVSKRHSLITAADLAGLPPNFDAKGDDLFTARDTLDAMLAKAPGLNVTGARTFAEIDVRLKEFDVWRAVELPESIAKRPMTWTIGTDGDTFTLRYPVFSNEVTGFDDDELTTSTKKLEERIVIQRNQLGHYDISVESTAPTTRPTLDASLSYAEDWFVRERRDSLTFVRRDARWRSAPVPATPSQLKWLKRKKVPHDPDTITKGEASRLLDIAFDAKP